MLPRQVVEEGVLSFGGVAQPPFLMCVILSDVAGVVVGTSKEA